MDPRDHNQKAWDGYVNRGNRWTVPVTAAQVAEARKGRWEIFLTPRRPVPRSWFPDLEGADVLCLASGGGQQGPLLAAAGARVVVLDSSPRQLDQDRKVAERDDLEIRTVLGDMADLSSFDSGTFDLVVNPASNCFVPSVQPVWAEAHRVLKPGGQLLAGFTNPVRFLVAGGPASDAGALCVRNPIPYSDLEHLTADEQARLIEDNEPLEFGHTLEDQIGGQIQTGFVVTGFFEDSLDPEEDPLSRYLCTFIATRALKPREAPDSEAGQLPSGERGGS